MKEKKLTPYQEKQLLHIHFEGDFQYKTDQGTRVFRKAWSNMVYTLIREGYVQNIGSGYKLTEKGQTYLDALHNAH